MGSWGYRHFDSDAAHDWMSLAVEMPLSLVIRSELSAFLRQKKVNRKLVKLPGAKTFKGYPGGHDEAIAAAALLDALSKYEDGADSCICLSFMAEERGLYSLAMRVVRECLADEFWISKWELEEQKRNQLGRLVVSLKRKARRERRNVRAFGKRRRK